jgi:hypothetical protein
MKSKRGREIAKLIDIQKLYKLDEAIDILKNVHLLSSINRWILH